MFTREGYDSIDLSNNSPVISDIVKDRWVLSDDESAKVDFIQEDLDEISAKVKALYMADYIANWNRVLDSLNVTTFKDINHADDTLSLFIDPVYSPLTGVLQVIADNTQLSSQLAQNLDEDHGDGKAGKVTSLLADTFKGTKVDQQFRDLNNLSRESSKRPAPIKAVIDQIQKLNEFIGQISVAPEPGKKSFDLAKGRFQSGAGNAVTSLQVFSKNLPQPVKRWMESLSDQTWSIVLSSAHQYVNREWKSQVYDVYKQGLAGRYPLNKKAKNELAMQDFSDFFKPGGTIDKFFTEFVKPFVDTRKGWKNRVVDNHSLGLNSSTLRQIQRAQDIKNVFFRNNPEVPGISFQLKPYFMSKIDARFWLDLGDQRISYNHGPKFWKDLNWSGDDDSSRVRIVFEDLDENHHEKSFEGPWAWFRLQDESKLTKTKQANIFVVSYNVREKEVHNSQIINRTIQYLIKAKSVNNPFSQNLLGSFSCPSSI
jgi:type VI secretion system protein ImpL